MEELKYVLKKEKITNTINLELKLYKCDYEFDKFDEYQHI